MVEQSAALYQELNKLIAKARVKNSEGLAKEFPLIVKWKAAMKAELAEKG